MAEMTSMERVLAALSHKEPDRAPFFFLFGTHGAKELGLGLREFFSSAENVAEGQIRLRAKYGHDCLYGFLHAPLEIEAWGGEVVYSEDGPPNTGEPPFGSVAALLAAGRPELRKSKGLQRALDAVSMLKERSRGEAPIIGVVVSPFSLPVVQLGMDRYLDAMYGDADEFERLMRLNEEYAVEWGNAQLAAGATAICYFDPVSSPTIVPKEIFMRFGLPVAKSVFSRLSGPAAMHFASGRCIEIMDDVAGSGAAIVSATAEEDIGAAKAAAAGRVSLIGNLNGLEMRHWTPAEAERVVRETLIKAAPGGGFILSDNHGEVPWYVPDEVLHAVAEAVRKWGRYPILAEG